MKGKLALVASLLVVACGDPSSSSSPSNPSARPMPSPASESASDAPTAYKQYWATAERVDRRACPSTRCGVVGQLWLRESAHVFEIRDGWARITKYYDASCVGGRSEYVDRGEAACSEANGIVDGKFAEWVNLNQIALERPADPGATATSDEELIAQSDDFQRYRRAFATAAAKLIAERRCTREEFIEQGGWTKSVNDRDHPVYFTYCGEMTAANRIYLDAESGRIFQ